MTFSDLGAIGEFLGFIAVAVTLIYFARQLRQNTASTRIAASWSMMEAFNLAHSEIFTRRETAELTLRVLQGGDLEPVEQIQVNSMTLRHSEQPHRYPRSVPGRTVVGGHLEANCRGCRVPHHLRHSALSADEPTIGAAEVRH